MKQPVHVAHGNKREPCILLVLIFLYTPKVKALTHFTAPWARRSHCTWQWVFAHHRPCVRPDPCLTSSAQRLWCQCNGRTGTWGTSCGGQSSAPAEDPYTTGRARLTGTVWGRPSCWNKEQQRRIKKLFDCVLICFETFITSITRYKPESTNNTN